MKFTKIKILIFVNISKIGIFIESQARAHTRNFVISGNTVLNQTGSKGQPALGAG
jgi:hypothetical protein